MAPGTEIVYYRLLSRLATLLYRASLPASPLADLDLTLLEYVHRLLDGDLRVTDAGHLRYALFWIPPGLRLSRLHTLPVTQATVAGLRKLVPGLTRPQVSCDVMLCLAQRTLARRHRMAEPCTRLLVKTRLKRNDVLNLSCMQIVPPLKGALGRSG